MALSSYHPLLDLLTTLLLVAVAALFGTRLVQALKLPPTKGLIDVSLATALGLGVLSYTTLLLGLLRLLTPLAAWAVLLVSGLFGLSAAPTLARSLRRVAGEVRVIAGAGRSATALVGLLGLIAGLNLVGSLAPVTYSDTLNHYMALARFAVEQGGLSFEPYKWWNMPAATEMLYADLLLLFPGAVGAPLEWVFGVLTLAVLSGLGLHLAGSWAALFAALLFYAIPFVIQESTIAKNDLALALYGLLGFAALVLFSGSGQQRWLLAAGLMAGLAMGTKLYGLLLGFGLGVGLLLLLVRERPVSLAYLTKGALVFGVVALAIASPWYLKAWLQGGDPIWPFGFPIFLSRQWDMASYLKFANYELGVGTGPLAFLLGPWSLTANLAAFKGERVPPVIPAFLALLPGLPLVWRRLSSQTRIATVLALASAAVYYAIWFALYQQPGYVLPALALLVLPTAVVASGLLLHSALLKRTAWAAILSVVAFGLITAVGYNAQFVRVVLGLEEPRSFVASKVFYFRDIEFANRSLPPGSKLLVFPLTDFYFDVAHLNGQPGFQGYVDYLTLDSEAKLLRRWRELGITHVFKDERYFDAGANFVRTWLSGEDRLRKQFASLAAQGILEPIYDNPQGVIVESRTLGRTERGRVVIYRVNYSREASHHLAGRRSP